MSRTLKIAVPIVVVFLVVAGGALWWFLRDDAPAEVDLDTAAESVATTTVPAGAGGPVVIDGTWVVDTTTGEFDFETATGTFAGFRIQEELSSIGSTTAVGRTGDVSGSITIADGTLTAARFDVDVTTFTTNERRRDSKVQSALESSTFPTATFTLTEPVDLGADAAAGDDVSITAIGDFTLHGVTRPVQVPIEARLVDRTIVLVGSFDVTFSDYGVETPEAPIVLSVSDRGTIEMQILLTRQ